MKSRRYVTILALVLIGALLFPMQPAMAKSSGTLMDLGTLGGSTSEAQKVNDNGQVVGSSTTATGELHAFIWQKGSMTDLGTLGGDFSRAEDINNAGQVVGWGNDAPYSENSHAFLWQNGHMLDLANPACDREGLPGFSRAHAINQDGDVVGVTCFPGFEIAHAFLWSQGTWTDLGDLGGGISEAWGINDVGQVVGASFTADMQVHAFLWQDGVMTDLGTPGGHSEARAINNLGQVVGFTAPDLNSAFAAVWNQGSMITLGPAAGSQGSFASDINNKGQVVGYLGFFWQNGVMTTPFPASGCSDYGINTKGQVVGSCLTAQLTQRAYLWTP